MTVTHDVGALEVGEPQFAPAPPAALVALREALDEGVARAFAAANTEGQQARANLFGLSMSSLGGCQREAAYRLAGAVPDEQYVATMTADEARAAMVGVWVHAGLLPKLAEILHAAQAEMPVTLRVPVWPPGGSPQVVVVDGTADCYTREAGGGVIDLKTVGSYRLGDIADQGAADSHRHQVRGYAAALVQQGMPVAWTAWVYLDRGDGSVHVVIEPFGRAEYDQVLRRVERVHGLAADPDYAPRSERGPGLSWRCDACPFLRRCWGPDARPGDKRAIAVHDRPQIAFAAQRYVEIGRQIRELEKQKDFYRAQVGKAPAGLYGKASVSYGRDGWKTDLREAERRLEELGEEVPLVPNPGKTYIRAAVPAKKETNAKD